MGDVVSIVHSCVLVLVHKHVEVCIRCQAASLITPLFIYGDRHPS